MIKIKNINNSLEREFKDQMIRMIQKELLGKLATIGYDTKKLIEMNLYNDCKDEALLIALAIDSQKDHLILSDAFSIVNEGIDDFIHANFGDYNDNIELVGLVISDEIDVEIYA